MAGRKSSSDQGSAPPGSLSSGLDQGAVRMGSILNLNYSRIFLSHGVSHACESLIHVIFFLAFYYKSNIPSKFEFIIQRQK